MKYLVTLLLATSSFVPVVAVNAQGQIVQQQDVAPAGTGEKQLLEVASGAQLNVLIDSTDLMPYEAETKVELQKNATNSLILMAQEQQLSSLNFGPTTILFWKEPDSIEIAKKVAQGQGFGRENGAMPVEIVLAELYDYVVANQKPDAELGRFNFKYTDLPGNLQQQLAAHIFQQTLSGVAADFNELWFNDALWSKSNIYYVPATPNMTGSRQSLILCCNLQTPTGNWELKLDLNRGGSSTSPLKAAFPEAPILPDLFRVWPLENIEAAGQSVAIQVPVVQAGSAAKAYNVSWETAKGASLAHDPKLAELIAIEPVRQPLTAFVAKLATQSKVELALSPEVKAKNYFISATLSDMTVESAIRAVARLYDLGWSKNADGSYMLNQNQRTAFDTQLLRTGYLPWYRFRDWNTGALKERDAEFEKLIQQVFEEAGPNVKAYPGVPFTNLLPATQTQLRDGVQRMMARSILTSQMQLFPYVQGEWSFVLDPAGRNLKLFLDGVPKQAFVAPPRPRGQRFVVPVAT